MPKCQTSLNPEWKIEHECIPKSSRDQFHGFYTLCISVKCIYFLFYFLHSLFVYLCISITSRSPEIVCVLALCQIICLFMYLFLLLPEVQKCYVFRHCALCKTGSSQWSVFETDITMSWINTNTVNKHFFASSVTYRSTSRYILYGRSNCLAMNTVGYFIFTVSWYHRYDGQNCIVVVSTPESYAIILASLNATKFPPFWCYGNGHPISGAS